ncbi:hypothetical protein CR513_42051, partial [Mucuna pruriens]
MVKILTSQKKVKSDWRRAIDNFLSLSHNQTIDTKFCVLKVTMVIIVTRKENDNYLANVSGCKTLNEVDMNNYEILNTMHVGH